MADLTPKALDRLVRDAAGKPETTIQDTRVRGLRLRVRPSGAASWFFSYRTPGVGGQRGPMRRLTIGAYPAIGLAEARAEASTIASELQRWRNDGSPHGEDPAAKRSAAKVVQSSSAGIEAATMAWLRGAEKELRPKTMEGYRGSARKLIEWSESARISRLSDITRAHLESFRAYLVALPLSTSAKGPGRGKKVTTDRRRSPYSINRDIRGAWTILNALRRQGDIPKIDRDALSDCLRIVTPDKVRPSRLKTPQISRLLAACDRHDAETFAITRAEHAGAADPGSTPRYTPIATFVRFMLLTGMRLGEALSITWDDVDLDTTDWDGRPVGQIEVRAENVKTATDRVVYLGVCPSVRRLLAKKKLQGSTGRVWSEHTRASVTSARERLHEFYGAPEFLWSGQHSKDGLRSPPTLRSTCATYLHSAPGVYGGGSALHLACAQLGHAPEVARKRYAGVETSIPREARTLEEAMRISDDAAVGSASSRPPQRSPRSA